MAPSFFQAIILGIVQGITEFLPISSTGHLRLIPRLVGWNDAGITFDAALHTGTLIAVILFFWKDWVQIFRGAFSRSGSGRSLLVGILVGTVPVGIAYLLLNGTIAEIEDGHKYDRLVMGIVSSMLLIVAVVMHFADRLGKKDRPKLAQIGPLDWIIVGIAQATAIIPGVSRSGATISAGLFRGLTRENAARYSFLLSTPAFAAGTLSAIKDAHDNGFAPSETIPAVVGMVASAIVGIIVIKFLLAYLQKHGLGLFVWYRVVLATIILTLLACGIV